MLLQEALGHVITVELKTGQLFRGKLLDGQALFLSVLVVLTVMLHDS
jgi:small nuclear ribonucleoprotein D3